MVIIENWKMIPKDAKSLFNRLDKECEANETKKEKSYLYISTMSVQNNN